MRRERKGRGKNEQVKNRAHGPHNRVPPEYRLPETVFYLEQQLHQRIFIFVKYRGSYEVRGDKVGRGMFHHPGEFYHLRHPVIAPQGKDEEGYPEAGTLDEIEQAEADEPLQLRVLPGVAPAAIRRPASAFCMAVDACRMHNLHSGIPLVAFCALVDPGVIVFLVMALDALQAGLFMGFMGHRDPRRVTIRRGDAGFDIRRCDEVVYPVDNNRISCHGRSYCNDKNEDSTVTYPWFHNHLILYNFNYLFNITKDF